MKVDKIYCASSFLMYRTVIDDSKQFCDGMPIHNFKIDFNRTGISSASELLSSVELQMYEWTKDGRAALALSGGIDSAILAKFMPGGGCVYTFQCIVPGLEVTNEVPAAAKYAEECGLRQKVVPIYWEDMENYTPLLMRHKGAPIHSIEVQIYKAALQAKADGFDRLIFGESSDVNYGGQSGLLSRDWTIGEFIDRYSYVKPYHVLKQFSMPTEAYVDYAKNGYIDVHEFNRNVYLCESMGSYINACECAGIKMESPYVHTFLSEPLDYTKIRSGNNKYIVREAFEKLYPNYVQPEKIPMPRATNEWLKDWTGPKRPEFWPHCTDGMTGDQKWLVWSLEKFFDILDEKEVKTKKSNINLVTEEVG